MNLEKNNLYNQEFELMQLIGKQAEFIHDSLKDIIVKILQEPYKEIHVGIEKNKFVYSFGNLSESERNILKEYPDDMKDIFNTVLKYNYISKFYVDPHKETIMFELCYKRSE